MFPWLMILCFVLFVPLNVYLGIQYNSWMSWAGAGFVSGLTFGAIITWAIDRL